VAELDIGQAEAVAEPFQKKPGAELENEQGGDKRDGGRQVLGARDLAVILALFQFVRSASSRAC